MRVEVGKTYRGIVNGCVFTITKSKISEDGLEYLTAKTNDKEYEHMRNFFEHLLIEEVENDRG